MVAKKAPKQEELPEVAVANENTRTVAKVGKFEFKVTKGLPIPEAPGRAPSAVALPFKESFLQMDINEEFFIPHEFWTAPKADGGRDVAEDKATSSYIRAKVRGAFNELVAAPATKTKMEGKQLVLFERKEGDPMGDDGKQTYPKGFSAFVVSAV